MNNMESVEKKLREAQSSLDKMREQEQRAFGDKEPSDDYLSAFLNAARTVDYRLRHEYPTTYPAWRDGWMPRTRMMIVTSGSYRVSGAMKFTWRRKVKTKEVKVGVGGSYPDKGGSTLQVFGTSTPLTEGVNTGATICLPAYVFEMEDGTEHPVTDVCAEGFQRSREWSMNFALHFQAWLPRLHGRRACGLCPLCLARADQRVGRCTPSSSCLLACQDEATGARGS